MKPPLQKLMAFIQDDSGASAVEYALLVALIGVAIIVGASTLGTQINSTLNTASSTMAGS